MARVRRIFTTPPRMVGWAVGVPLAALRFLTRKTKVREQEWEADDALASMDADGSEVTGDDPADAFGPALHRLFRVKISDPVATPEQLVGVIASNPNVVAPFEVLRFEKTSARDERDLQEGDELLIRMAGPWDGPVTIVDRGPASFRAATRRSHAQSGQFELRALAEDDGSIRFEVETWDRADRRLLAFLHHRIGLTERMQLHTWVHVCEQAVRLAGGRPADGIAVYTQREQDPDGH